MLIEHRGRRPVVHPTATIAPTAVLCGDVTIGARSRVLHGAVLTSEDGSIVVGEACVIMEHALVRGRSRHPVRLGDRVLLGPHAHVNGASLGDETFIATGASVFPGAILGAGAEVRINGVVQVRTRLEPGAMVPIGWVAVGDPAVILPPERHEDIWANQRELDFTGTVYGVGPGEGMREIMDRQSDFYAAHTDDVVLDPGESSDGN
jgi:gamma-carbonic anhydrase